MKTIVFLETNFSGLDAFLYCQNKGYKSVLITDSPERFKSWFPESVLYKLEAATQTIKVANSNDVLEVKQAIESQVGKIDAILTFAEIRTQTVATLAREFNLKGTPLAAVQIAQDKHAFRARMRESGVDAIDYRIIDTIEALDSVRHALRYPCFIKPNHGHSSIGAFICRSEAEIGEHIARLKDLKQEGISASYVIEEYLDGPLVSVEMLTVAPGKHQLLGIADRAVVGASIEVGASFPIQSAVHKDVVALARGALDAIGYSFGPSHIEIIVTASGPHLVEVNSRVGGSGHSVMMDAALGRSVVGDCIELCLGQHVVDIDLYQGQKGAAWECFASETGGTIVKLPDARQMHAMPGVIAVWYHQDEGTTLGALSSNFNWIMQVVCVGDDAEKAKRNAQECIRYAAEHTAWA